MSRHPLALDSNPFPGLAAWGLGALEVLLAMAVIIWLLTWPALFRIYYPALGVSQHTRDATTVVQWLTTTHRTRSLNLALQDAKMETRELQHYSDVRVVFRWLPRLTGGLVVLMGLFVLTLKLDRTKLLSAQYRGLILWLICLLAVGGLAWWDWPAFFAWVHRPLFGDRSWRLPKNSYSLILFPDSYWRTMAAMVLLAPAVLLGWAALQLSRGQKKSACLPPAENAPEFHQTSAQVLPPQG